MIMPNQYPIKKAIGESGQKGIRASTVRRKLGILRGVAADVIPGRLRANEDMHFNLNSGITVNGTQSDSVHFASARPFDVSLEGLLGWALTYGVRSPRCRLPAGAQYGSSRVQ